MNIKQSYVVLSNNIYSDEQKLKVLNQLSEYINGNNFNFKEVLESDKKYSKILFCSSAKLETLYKLSKFKIINIENPNLLFHSILMKFSQANFIEQDLENLVETLKIFNNIKKPKLLSYGIGYILGKALYSGINCNCLIDLCNFNIIKDYILFESGLSNVITLGNSKLMNGLAFDKYYTNELLLKYKDWDDIDFYCSIKAMQLTSEIKNKIFVINPINEKIAWFLNSFFPNSNIINKLHKGHKEAVEGLQISEEMNEVINKEINRRLSEELRVLAEELNNNNKVYLIKELNKLQNSNKDIVENIINESKNEVKSMIDENILEKNKLKLLNLL